MKREELERLRGLKRMSQELNDRLQRLFEQATRTTALLDGLPRCSALRSKVEDSVVKLESAIEETRADIFELLQLEQKFTEEISTLPAMERRVLTMRYLDGLGYPGIANELGRSTDHVFKLHRRGLKKILTSGQ